MVVWENSRKKRDKFTTGTLDMVLIHRDEVQYRSSLKVTLGFESYSQVVEIAY